MLKFRDRNPWNALGLFARKIRFGCYSNNETRPQT